MPKQCGWNHYSQWSQPIITAVSGCLQMQYSSVSGIITLCVFTATRPSWLAVLCSPTCGTLAPSRAGPGMMICAFEDWFLAPFYEALDCLPLAWGGAIFEFYFLREGFLDILKAVEVVFWPSIWAAWVIPATVIAEEPGGWVEATLPLPSLDVCFLGKVSS